MSDHKVPRSKGAATLPTTNYVTGATFKRSNFQDLFFIIMIVQFSLIDLCVLTVFWSKMLLPLLGKRNESDSFIESLFLIKDLKEQIRSIQKFKSVFLKDFSFSKPTDGALLDPQILLKLYLHPDHSL